MTTSPGYFCIIHHYIGVASRSNSFDPCSTKSSNSNFSSSDFTVINIHFRTLRFSNCLRPTPQYFQHLRHSFSYSVKFSVHETFALNNFANVSINISLTFMQCSLVAIGKISSWISSGV